MADYELKGTVIDPRDNETMMKLTDMYSKYMKKAGPSRQIMISTCEGTGHIEMMARACCRVFLRSLYDEYVIKEEKPIDIDEAIGRRARYVSIGEFKRSPIEPDTESIEIIRTVDSKEIRKRMKEYMKKNTVIVKKAHEGVEKVKTICGYPVAWIDGIEDQTIGRRRR